MLVPESAVDKLKDTVHSSGAHLHVVEDSLFSAALTDAEACAHAPAQQQQAGDAQGEGRGWGASGGGEDRGDGALIIYTSGTTGRPKGALHTHG